MDGKTEVPQRHTLVMTATAVLKAIDALKPEPTSPGAEKALSELQQAAEEFQRVGIICKNCGMTACMGDGDAWRWFRDAETDEDESVLFQFSYDPSHVLDLCPCPSCCYSRTHGVAATMASG